MGVINPEAGEKAMDTSTRSMRHSSAIGMRLWKMWREAEGRVSSLFVFLGQLVVRKLDLSHLCFSLNFYFSMLLRLFPSMFPMLTYSQSFFSLIC